MQSIRPILIAMALSASAAPALAQKVYASTQADPVAPTRPLTACVYGGQVFTQGAVMQAGTGIVLKCVVATDDSQQSHIAVPVWATLASDTKPVVKPRK